MSILSPFHVSGQLEEISEGVITIPSRKRGGVPTGQRGWWDFSDDTTVNDSGGTCTTISDKTGNGWTLTQSWTAINYGARTINGLKTLDYQGEFGGFYNGSIPATDVTCTRYIVAMLDSISGDEPLLSVFNEHNAGLHVRNVGANRLISYYIAGSGAESVLATHDSATVVTGVPFVAMERRDTNQITLGINQVRETESWTLTGSPGSNEAGLMVGFCHIYRDKARLDGLIGEIMDFDSVRSDAQVESDVGYLMSKWGIA